MGFYKLFIRVVLMAWLFCSTSFAMGQEGCLVTIDLFGFALEINFSFGSENSVDMIYFDHQNQEVPVALPIPEYEHVTEEPITDLPVAEEDLVIQKNAHNIPSRGEESFRLRLEGEPMPERLMPLLTQVLLKKAKEHFMKNPGDAFYVEDILQKNGVTTCYVVRE